MPAIDYPVTSNFCDLGFGRACSSRLKARLFGNLRIMIIVGLILMLIGFVAAIPILWTVGIVVALVGIVLLVLGHNGRRIGGRSHYF